MVYGPPAAPDKVRKTAGVVPSFSSSTYERCWQRVSMLLATSTVSVTSLKVMVAVAPLTTFKVAGEKTASLMVVVSHGSIMVTVKEIVSVSVNYCAL